MKQAEQNNITWGTSGNQMTHLKSFKISQNLKTEEQDDKTTKFLRIYIQSQVGHSNFLTTMNAYSKLIKDVNEHAVNVLEKTVNIL